MPRQKHSATSSRSTQSDFSTTATNTFSISRRPVASSSIGWRLAFRIRTKATSRGGRTLVEAIYAVAATRGSFPTKQFRAARKNDHTLRHSRLQLAEWCIKLHGVSRVETMLDPFLGIGNSAVAAQRCGVKNLLGLKLTRLISQRRSGGLSSARVPHTRKCVLVISRFSLTFMSNDGGAPGLTSGLAKILVRAGLAFPAGEMRTLPRTEYL